jgi:hypothetical protein
VCETCSDGGIDLRLVCQQPGLNQCCDITWNFDPTGSALGTNQFAETLRMLFMMENIGAEPIKQRFFVGTTKFAYFGDFTDLCSMRFDGAPFPVVLSKKGSIDSDLSSKKAYHLRGCLLSGTQEAAFILEALE